MNLSPPSGGNTSSKRGASVHQTRHARPLKEGLSAKWGGKLSTKGLLEAESGCPAKEGTLPGRTGRQSPA